METMDKLKNFDRLVNNYVEIINCLLDMSIRNNLLPMRILITVPFLREYIEKNKKKRNVKNFNFISRSEREKNFLSNF